MTTTLFVRRFLSDYARNPINLLVLVLVPMVFVVVTAGAMADAAELLGGATNKLAVETATAGWAAGFLAAIAMYFQVSAAREADRRVVIAGLPGPRLVTARLLAGLALAGLVSATALIALALRTGIDHPYRVIAGTLMYAVIYLAIGAVVGATVRNPVNGTVLILFVWMIDLFFGPAMTSADRIVTRGFPTHFVTLWMVDLPFQHGGRLGDLGWALVWVMGAAIVAFVVVAGTTRVARVRRTAAPGSGRDQLTVAVRAGWRDWRRNPVLWVLLVIVPLVFIVLADATTPHGSDPIVVNEGGQQITRMIDPANIHGATMAPVTIASLAALAGMFLVLDARTGDRRLVLAGMRSGLLLAARLAIVVLAALLATTVSLAAVAAVSDADQWGVYAAANALVGITYGLLGVLLGPIFSRVGGVLIAFLLPFIDVAIGQSPMLRDELPVWARFLPGYGSGRVVVDGALTASFDEVGALLIALVWLAGLGIIAGLLFHQPHRTQQTR